MLISSPALPDVHVAVMLIVCAAVVSIVCVAVLALSFRTLLVLASANDSAVPELPIVGTMIVQFTYHGAFVTVAPVVVIV